MLRLLSSIVAFSAACVGASAVPGEVFSRASAKNFSLFAYGSASNTKIGGFPLFYDDGYAYIANPSKVSYTADYVYFVENSTQWIANPLTVDTASWSKSIFYIPDGSGPVGFYTEGGDSNVSQSDIITSGFDFYGSNAMVNINNIYYTAWYAASTATDGLWSVGWNATNPAEVELLSLRFSGGTNVNYPFA